MDFENIGAHYGFFTLPALRFGGPDAQVLAAEPSATATSILRRNLRLNKADKRTRVCNVALCPNDGRVELLSTGPFGSDYMLVRTRQRLDEITITQRSLNSLLAECGFEPTHVKSDVEGYESEVLIGALATLREHRPILLLELHAPILRKRGIDPNAVLCQLEAAGYQSVLCGGVKRSKLELGQSGCNSRLVCSTAN